VSLAYQRQDVRRKLASWWGNDVFNPDGSVSRPAVARRVFSKEQERRRLEQFLHPLVGRMRDEAMAAAAGNSAVRGYIWDAPLLVEAGLAGRCDAVIFVDAPLEERERRVKRQRGWDAAELRKREKSQLALDKKREIAKYIVCNTAGAGDIRSQVREVLSRILAGFSEGKC
jgi:dephospho-CoA kinase